MSVSPFYIGKWVDGLIRLLVTGNSLGRVSVTYDSMPCVSETILTRYNTTRTSPAAASQSRPEDIGINAGVAVAVAGVAFLDLKASEGQVIPHALHRTYNYCLKVNGWSPPLASSRDWVRLYGSYRILLTAQVDQAKAMMSEER